jgi:hypothetical protein
MQPERIAVAMRISALGQDELSMFAFRGGVPADSAFIDNTLID